MISLIVLGKNTHIYFQPIWDINSLKRIIWWRLPIFCRLINECKLLNIIHVSFVFRSQKKNNWENVISYSLWIFQVLTCHQFFSLFHTKKGHKLLNCQAFLLSYRWHENSLILCMLLSVNIILYGLIATRSYTFWHLCSSLTYFRNF